MATTIKIGKAQIRDEDYAIQANAVLGIRGTGKTTLAKSIAEQMLDAQIPIIVFDPTGVWRYLKRGAKKGQRGYKIVVAGGVEPDLQLTPSTAAEIVRAAIKENVSLVIDLYDRKLSKSDWRRIVRDCFRTLMYENEGVRHIFLEEAAEFAPQRIQDGETYAEVEKVVRMGGNASLGITLINQRSQEVNKAVLELCENLILMKQRGSHAITALSKWIDQVDPKVSKQVTERMPNMEAGECFVFRGDGQFTKTHGNTLATFHPDRRRPEAIKRAGTSPDVAKFVAALGERLKDKSALETMETLRAEVKRLQRELVEGSKMDNHAFKTHRVNKKTEAENKKLRLWIKQLEHRVGSMRPLIGDATHAIEKIAKIASKSYPVLPERTIDDFLTLKPKGEITGQTRKAEFATVLRPQLEVAQRKYTKQLRDLTDNAVRESNGAKLGKGNRAVLTVLAQYPDGVDETQIAILTGYKASTRYQSLKELRANGYAARSGDQWVPTETGLAALGSFEQLPTGRDLIQYWLARLGKGEATIFGLIVDSYPERISKKDLEEKSGYKGSTTYQSLKELRARRLITLDRGSACASEGLFEE